MNEKMGGSTPDTIDINRANADDRTATWDKLDGPLLDIATKRGIDHVAVVTALWGAGDGVADAVERIGNALYDRPDKQHIVFLADTTSTNERWDPKTLYVNIVMNPGIGDNDADALYAEMIHEILRATVIDNPCKVRWQRDDRITDGVVSEMGKPAAQTADAAATDPGAAPATGS